MNLVPKRKIQALFPDKSKEIVTLRKTFRDEIINQVDVRNIGRFDYRLKVPVGTDKFD